MKKVELLLWLSGCLLASCRPSHPVMLIENDRINLETALDKTRRCMLSELCDSLVCIPLETNDSSLLSNRAYLIYANESDLFISSGQYIYRFSCTGAFKGKIGRKGNAPGEYSILYSVSVDEAERSLLYYVGQERMQFWGYDGRFIKEIRLESEGKITNAYLMGKERIVAEERIYSDEGALEVNLLYLNKDGNLQKRFPLQKDENRVNISMHTVPIMYSDGDAVKYKNINDDVFYTAGENGPEQSLIFDLGRYKPAREYLEDMDKKEGLLRDFAQIVDVRENKWNIFFLIVHDRKLKGVIVNQATGCLVGSQEMEIPQTGGGVKNDYVQGCRFWPSFIARSGAMYALVPLEKIPEAGLEEIRRHVHGDFQPAEDANPIVMIGMR